MAKITYASLKLKPKEEIKTFLLEDGREVEVYQNLSTDDRLDLVEIVLQKSKMDNLFNPILINAYFHLYLIYLCTNISFTDKQKEDELKLYDCLKDAEIVDKVVMNLPEDIYEDLIEKIDTRMEMELRYNTTAASVLNRLVTDLPRNAEAAAKIVEQFDPDKYQAVVDFAKAANGGRSIE